MLLRRYVNESEVKLHDLLLEDVDDLIKQARRQRDALFVDPGGVHDGGDRHRGKMVVPKTFALGFCPCKGLFVDFDIPEIKVIVGHLWPITAVCMPLTSWMIEELVGPMNGLKRNERVKS